LLDRTAIHKNNLEVRRDKEKKEKKKEKEYPHPTSAPAANKP